MLNNVSFDKYYTCTQEICVVDTIKGDVINDGDYNQALVFEPQWILRWTADEVIGGDELLEHFGMDITRMDNYFREATKEEIFKYKLSS